MAGRMPQAKGRSPGRSLDSVHGDWHLDTAAELERAGKFEQARIPLMRASLLKPAATYLDGWTAGPTGKAPFLCYVPWHGALTKVRNTLSPIITVYRLQLQRWQFALLLCLEKWPMIAAKPMMRTICTN